MKRNKFSSWLRLLLLLGILAYVTYESYLHQVLGGGKAASVHALCPLGGLESLYALFTTGSFLQKIYAGTVTLLIITVVLALLFRRSFCGLLCPFGALQELFARIGKKVLGRSLVVPASLDRPFRYVKYLVLLFTVAAAWYFGTLWISPYDPYSAYAHLSAVRATIEEEPLAVIGFFLLAVTVIGSFFWDRFFCKYLCPVGALYGLLGKFSLTRITRDDALCTHCNICTRACPANIEVAKAAAITSAECLSCNECVLACPKKGALTVKTAGRSIHPVLLLVLVAGLFFGGLTAAETTGNLQVLPPAPQQGQHIPISQLKGYFTITDAAEAAGIQLTQFYQRLGIPENVPPGTLLKEIGRQVPGFSLDEAKAKADQGR